MRAAPGTAREQNARLFDWLVRRVLEGPLLACLAMLASLFAH